jgi:hypothetical protein
MWDLLKDFKVWDFFFWIFQAFVKIKRLFKDIFREVEAFFFNKYEDFINITRFFEDIFREMEASV